MSTPEEEAGGGKEGESLWGGRFREPMAPEMVPLNRSLDVDRRLWPHDIQGSRAWVAALVRARVLTSREGDSLDRGLRDVGRRLEEAFPFDAPDEDIHSLVERLLREEVGDVAGKLHTGRSRNDQVATDVRLWGKEAVAGLEERLTELGRALLELAEGGVEMIMPGYTHLQQAQPVRAAHWALSHFWPLLRDRRRVRAVEDELDVLPLGSGALTGCPFPVDREALARDLGFDRVSENSMDAVSDRDWMASLLFAGALTGVHLSRLAEDLVLFSSLELGYIRLSDAFSTGSSLMPQKRNPDVAELARGKAGRLTGNLVTLLTVLKGLPTGYNRDLQEDKEPLFDTVDTLETTLPALAGAVRSAEFRPAHMRDALEVRLLATDLADHLVRQGVPFRSTHEVVGRLVRRAEEEGCGLDELPDEIYQEAHPAFGKDFREVFDWDTAVDARSAPGGTGGEAVLDQLRDARRRLEAGGDHA